MGNFKHTVDNLESGQRLDMLLSTCVGFSSRSSAAKAIDLGEVYVNGNIQSKNYSVKDGDIIEYSAVGEVEYELTSYEIDLNIRYEDDDMLILSKPVDLACHPSIGHPDKTLVNALIAHCGIDNLANLQGEDRLGIVHRLDKDTSGLMFAAKSEVCGHALQDGIRTRNIDRRYLALVHGYIVKDTGYIDAPISRHPKNRLKMCVSNRDCARSAVTTFSVLERFEAGKSDNGYCLVECKLFSGRTHQIRVHMSYIGHPVVGDMMYGTKKASANLDLDRQFLHSYRLSFDHPMTGERLEFFDELPQDLQTTLDGLKSRSMGRTDYGIEILERRLKCL